ncbi:hypothetical protein [Streptomyces sp. NPDC006645]
MTESVTELVMESVTVTELVMESVPVMESVMDMTLDMALEVGR